MATRAQLSEQDQNEYYDLYDVRVGVKAQTAESKCTGTGCQGVPLAPPVFATPASETFSGVGDFAPAPVVKPKQVRNGKAKHKAKSRRRRRRGSHSGKVKSTRGGVRRALVHGGERERGR